MTHRRRGPGVRLFFRDEYVYDAVEEGFRHTFDIERPRRIRDALISSGTVPPQDFEAPAAVSDEELLLVHTPQYLDQIRDPATLARFLLLDPKRRWDQGLLDQFRYASGGTLAAARAAAFEGAWGVNLGGGFHHAQADKAEGFCAIADVAVAIRCLRREGFAGRILVVDLDYHHGNGNALIFAGDETVFTFSMHNVPWCFIDKRNNRDVEIPAQADDETYLSLLRPVLPKIVAEFRPALAFYLAGSDPFIEDTLGDCAMSEAGLLERDRFVTSTLGAAGVPMVVVTAGGYGPSSWRIYYNYFRWLVTSAAEARA